MKTVCSVKRLAAGVLLCGMALLAACQPGADASASSSAASIAVPETPSAPAPTPWSMPFSGTGNPALDNDVPPVPKPPVYIHRVDISSFETPVAGDAEIPTFGHNNSMEEDISSGVSAIASISTYTIPYYKTKGFTYGAVYAYQVDYAGTFGLTTQDKAMEGRIAHRYDVSVIKDGQPTGEVWRYYVMAADSLSCFFLDETASTLRAVQIGNVIHLAGDEGFRWPGLMQDEIAEENTGNALAAYSAALGTASGNLLVTLDGCCYTIPPSTAPDDWYYLFRIYQGGNEHNGGILVGLVYMSMANPESWMVYKDTTQSYLPLRFSGGAFTAL